MPRKRTGTAYEVGGVWHIRITLPDGSRSKPIALPGYTEAKAREKALVLTELAAKGHATRDVRKPMGSTFTDWSVAWFASRARRGFDVDHERGRFKKWVLDDLGAEPMTGITKSDVEGIVERLDNAIQLGVLAWKSAANVFGLVTKAFDDAQNAKERVLRVRADNPCDNVRGPDRGVRKAKEWLRPNELITVLSNETVPVRHRRALALAVYLYPRAGELRALQWEDIDFESRVVRFHRSTRVDGLEKGTKTGEARTVPLEAALIPMLRQMHEEAGGVGNVTRLPDEIHLSRWLRATLQWVGVNSGDRSGMLTTTATRKGITWHDLRATGITWRAIRGDDALKIQRQAGHTDLHTTQIYIREADAVAVDNFGEVFPTLPAALVAPESSESIVRVEAKHLKLRSGRRDLNAKPHAETLENKAFGESKPFENQLGDDAKCAKPGALTIGLDESSLQVQEECDPLDWVPWGRPDAFDDACASGYTGRDYDEAVLH